MNKTALAILMIPFLSACQKNEQKTPVPSVAGNVTAQGPSDGGGGDTCNGKIIESYKVDIVKLDEFKEFILPILNKIASIQGDKDKKSPFFLTPNLKNWYLIDCKLQDIPKDRKGLYLETYQTAVHTNREIFIDSSSYNKMSKEEKAKLLLHEMIMSYYLVKYLSLDEICKMSNSCSGDFEVIGKWKMFRPEAYRPLNSEDHQKIRNVTAWLWSQGDALSSENFTAILKNNDFDRRFFALGSDASGAKEIEVDIQTLLRMFKKHQWTHSFPKFCQFAPTTVISSSICQTEITADIKEYEISPKSKMKQLYLKIKVTRESDKKEFEQEFTFPLVSENQKVKLYMSKIGSVLSAAPFAMTGNWPNMLGVKAVEGLKSQMLFFMLNLSNRENPEIYQIMFHTYIWYSFENEIVKRDGSNYIETYGYPALVPEETESLFVENELPFKFNSFLQTKVFVKSMSQ